MIETKNWRTGEVIHSGDFADIEECLLDAIKNDANLCDANLCGANLRDANLCDANLCDADLDKMSASIPAGEEYWIYISPKFVKAGCKSYTPEEWRKMSKQDIALMDGKKALKFYPRLLDLMDFFLGKGDRPEWISNND